MYEVISDIIGVSTCKMRRTTGHFSDLRKAYPTYFDHSESNGEVNLKKKKNSNHNMSNFINKVLNFELKLNTHQATDRKYS